MFSSLYWDRLEEGTKRMENYIDFRCQIIINNNYPGTNECGYHNTNGFILCSISFLPSKAFAVPESSGIC